MSVVIERSGSILPLTPHKRVRIIEKGDGYAVICDKPEMTPGVYSIIAVEPNEWYTIDLRCTRFGIGTPGLWIGTITKKTLFYGNFFNEYSPMYLKRKFCSGPYKVLLVGVLVKNAVNRSGFFIDQFSIERDEKIEDIKPVTPAEVPKVSKDRSVETNAVKRESLDSKDLKNPKDPKDLKDNVEDPKDRSVETNVVQRESLDSKDLKDPKDKVEEVDEVEEVEDPKDPKDLKDKVEEVEEIEDSKEREGLEDGDDKFIEDTEDITSSDEDLSQSEEFLFEDEGKIVYEVEELDISLRVRSYNLEGHLGDVIYPIYFGIPEEYIVENFPTKTRDFFPLKIGADPIESYKNKPSNYWKDLRESRFITIGKIKKGWEMIAVVEALSQGCIPLFLEEIPSQSMQFIPKTFLDNVRKMEGLYLGWIDHDIFSLDEYKKMADILVKYTKNHLTTKSIANYIVKTREKEVKSVLILSFSHEDNDHLLQQSVIHGFKELLGPTNVLDLPKVNDLYRKVNPKNKSIRRGGVPYAGILKDRVDNRKNIEDRIAKHEFDLVIIFGCYRPEDTNSFPYKDIIKDHYTRDDIYFIDGCVDPKKTKDSIEEFINHGRVFRLEYDY